MALVDLEMQDVFYPAKEYIETQAGNKVSRDSVLCGPQNVVLNGKTIIQRACIIRGDLANVKMGRCCVVGTRSVLRPGIRLLPGDSERPLTFLPLVVGDYVTVEEDSVVSASNIGHYVRIGKNCVIGRRCVIKDCCEIADNTVIPPDFVVPPFSLVAGSPARIVKKLPECTMLIHKQKAKEFYDHFVSRKKK